MDSVMKVRSEVHMQEWAGLIAECQASTKTVTAWCEEHGINIKSYYYWLRKVRLRAMQSMPECNSGVPMAQQKSDNISFKPLEISSPSIASDTAVTLHLPNATLEVARGADRETIEAVLQALKTVC